MGIQLDVDVVLRAGMALGQAARGRDGCPPAAAECKVTELTVDIVLLDRGVVGWARGSTYAQQQMNVCNSCACKSAAAPNQGTLLGAGQHRALVRKSSSQAQRPTSVSSMYSHSVCSLLYVLSICGHSTQGSRQGVGDCAAYAKGHGKVQWHAPHSDA